MTKRANRFWSSHRSAAQRLLPAVFLSSIVLAPAMAFPMEILVPAYFYPTLGPYWGMITADATRVPITAILNPASGPGQNVDPNYVEVFDDFHAAGGKILGYVASSYAQRDLEGIEADVETYASFYAIDGIFVDEMTNDTLATHHTYYAELYDFIKARHPTFRVMGNPGANTQEAYLSTPTVDALLTFEFYDGYRAYTPDAWTALFPPSAFAHVPYRVASADTMRAYVQLAASRNAGMVFVTDADLPNPYDRLPSYWAEEVACVATMRAADVPLDPVTHRWELVLNILPNPVQAECRIRLGCLAGGGADIWIVDPTGRVVARFGHCECGTEVRWPRREGERAKAAGAYLILARDRRAQTARKVLLVP